MKRIFFILLFVSSLLQAFAYRTGDRVTLLPSARVYETGETIPVRFLERNFLVSQPSSARHQGAVLLSGIYSWVYSKDIVPASPTSGGSDLNIAHSDVDVNGNRYVVLYDTVYRYVTDTVVMRDTVYVNSRLFVNFDTLYNRRMVAQVSYDTVYVDAKVSNAEFIPHPDTIYMVRRDTVYREKEKASDNDRSVRNVRSSYDQVFVSLRGGIDAYTGNGGFVSSWTPGFAGFLDLGYTRYFADIKSDRVHWGIHTGLSLGYAMSSLKGSYSGSYTTADTQGGRLDYHVSVGSYRESLQAVQLQVPLMASLYYKGFFLDFGVRMMTPAIFQRNRYDVSPAEIKAYYEPYDVTLVNERITGLFDGGKGGSNGTLPVFSLLGSVELGGSWTLKGGDRIALGVYSSYSVLDVNAKAKDSALSLLTISKVGGVLQDPCARVSVNSALDMLKLSYFDVGLKLSYCFNFSKKR